MRQEDVQKILEVGIWLSAERDFNRLLERILTCAMDLTNCDAGTLYLLDREVLRFKIMRNDTLRTYSGGDGQDPGLPPVPLDRSNVCAFALLEDRTVRIEDVKNCEEYDFSGPKRYDLLTGYQTRSMLVVPMRNREGERIGVLQLINATDAQGTVCAFAEESVRVIESVASQAAITIQNVRYIEQIKELFRSFVRVMSSAVDERTPYNGSHTRHMAAYGDRFIEFINSRGEGLYFSPRRKEEILMSIWLHDIGKLVTPLEVMNKVSRLLPGQRDAFTHRMEVVRLQARIDCLSGRITGTQREALERETREAEELICRTDRAGFVDEETLRRLAHLRERICVDGEGKEQPWLAADEYEMLCIRKGTLSEQERRIMEQHVSVTDRLLSQIHFSPEFSHVREWAASHHELLNGEGYPAHKKGDEIPCEVRIITILDIFDALVADDRPYKPGMPVERALSILDGMAKKEGKLDPHLTELFIESRCWEEQN